MPAPIATREGQSPAPTREAPRQPQPEGQRPQTEGKVDTGQPQTRESGWRGLLGRKGSGAALEQIREDVSGGSEAPKPKPLIERVGDKVLGFPETGLERAINRALDYKVPEGSLLDKISEIKREVIERVKSRSENSPDDKEAQERDRQEREQLVERVRERMASEPSEVARKFFGELTVDAGLELTALQGYDPEVGSETRSISDALKYREEDVEVERKATYESDYERLGVPLESQIRRLNLEASFSYMHTLHDVARLIRYKENLLEKDNYEIQQFRAHENTPWAEMPDYLRLMMTIYPGDSIGDRIKGIEDGMDLTTGELRSMTSQFAGAMEHLHTNAFIGFDTAHLREKVDKYLPTKPAESSEQQLDQAA